MMPVSSINLEVYQDQITDLIFTGISVSTIVSYLRDTYGLQVSLRTLQRRLQAWNVTVRPQTQDTPALRDRIVELFFNRLKETQLLQILQQENYQIGQYSLVRIQQELGLKQMKRNRPHSWPLNL
jgi:hypothetical protein